ncbi:MAG: argininosuccinate synthase [Candidatus Saganbacteria bacterium]|nr:argininosuccinate synthase [Candidatus Saganbacteria bacterium]
MIKKVVLAYSGGLDTSIIIPWLRENYGCEVIAMVGNVCQEEDYAAIKKKALKSGASKCYVEDVTEEFAKDYLLHMIKSGAIYEGRYLLGTSIARPVIAKRQVEIAKKEGAEAVSHGATGKGNDQVRFELTFKALAPNLKIIAPWREWGIRSRTDAMEYAKQRGIPVPVTKAKPYSSDRNLWHISFEGGILEDPWASPPENMFVLSVSPEKAPNKPQLIDIEFKKGVPVKINGKAYAPAALIQTLNAIAGKHGVGRVDIVENRLVGIKSRGVYETPGGTVLMKAHQDLESITLERDLWHYKRLIAERYAQLIYNGQWFSPLRKALDAFISSTQEKVTGVVRVKLYKGNCTIVGRKSHYSLYSEALATFEEGESYNQKDAEGFINLFGLPLKMEARREGK